MPKRLKNWEDLDGDAYDACILGNGASMEVWEKFGYRSLLTEAQRTGRMPPGLDVLFEELNTSDFEYILRVLWHATLANSALGDSEAQAVAAYETVRSALVRAVRSVHCDYTDAESALEPIGRWLSRYRKVFSLSYDLVVYWALLRHNEEARRNAFKDCFRSGAFQHDVWEDYHESFDGGPDATLVFYPHGHLMLTTNADGTERKMSASDSRSLIDRITERWEDGDAIPLFVAEGTSEQKRRAIGRSAYLSTVYSEVLARSGRSVVLHGLSLGSDYNDVHILRALRSSRVRRVAVSIFTDHGKITKHRAQRSATDGLLRQHLGEEIDIEFYDAQSKGCWTRA